MADNTLICGMIFRGTRSEDLTRWPAARPPPMLCHDDQLASLGRANSVVEGRGRALRCEQSGATFA
jgi:hypothetical protein